MTIGSIAPDLNTFIEGKEPTYVYSLLNLLSNIIICVIALCSHVFLTLLKLCGADSFKSPKCDCKFQHFAVIIRNVTAKC